MGKQAWFVEQPTDLSGECRRAPGFEQQTVLIVADHLRHPAEIRGNDGQSRREGLADHERSIFDPHGGNNERVYIVQRLRHPLVRNGSQLADERLPEQRRQMVGIASISVVGGKRSEQVHGYATRRQCGHCFEEDVGCFGRYQAACERESEGIRRPADCLREWSQVDALVTTEQPPALDRQPCRPRFHGCGRCEEQIDAAGDVAHVLEARCGGGTQLSCRCAARLQA